MNATDLIAKTLEITTELLLTKALDGLTDEDLLSQPDEDSNPIGWLLWHQTRTEDNIISRFSGKPPVWAEEGWEQRIPLPEGANDSGFGHTPEQMRAFRPKKADLVAYAQAVRQNSLAVLPSISASSLDAPVEDPPAPAIQKEGDFLAILLTDYIQHAGQIAYLRGHLKGFGWLGF